MKNKELKPHFTVIIPTRDRSETLYYSLRTVLAQTYSNFQIIVSDNQSNDRTKEIVMSFNDPRILYYNTGERLSMSHNWEFALSKINDGYITILGDDDGLLPFAIENAASLIEQTGAEALMTEACHFYWPSQADDSYGRLQVPLGKKIEKRDSKEWLKKLMSGKVNISHLPTLYTGGFIHSSVIERIKEISPGNRFYHSAIPDVYSAIAIASVTDSYIFSFEPLSVVGLSKNSTGASVLNEEDYKKSPANIFYSEPNIPFHAEIPLSENGRIPSSDQVYKYESYLQSAFLRKEDITVSHESQVKVVYSQSKGQHPSVREWCKRFTDIHEVSYKQIRWRSYLYNIYLRLESVPRRLRYEANMYLYDTPEVPINDICEAVTVTAAVRHYSTLRRFGRLIFLFSKIRKLIL